MVKVSTNGETKKLWQSHTFWGNLLVTVGGLFTAVGIDLLAGGTLTVIGVLNIIVRLKTNKKIEF